LELTLAEENYLKAIFFISGTEGNLVNTNAIAERQSTKAATVTDMLRKLKDKELIEYQPYKGSRLSTSGRVSAVAVLRKHRLWETFLVEKLGFGWEEVHEIAEQLEHIRSTELTRRLSSYLGNPQFDPHGDPIPDEHGVFPARDNLTLDKALPGETVAIKGVKDSSRAFLTYVANRGISLGDRITLINFEDFDQSAVVQMDKAPFHLSAQACSNLYISRL
jgi:DtxR family Mn-dependent transcriptional regulator